MGSQSARSPGGGAEAQDGAEVFAARTSAVPAPATNVEDRRLSRLSAGALGAGCQQRWPPIPRVAETRLFRRLYAGGNHGAGVATGRPRASICAFRDRLRIGDGLEVVTQFKLGSQARIELHIVLNEGANLLLAIANIGGAEDFGELTRQIRLIAGIEEESFCP